MKACEVSSRMAEMRASSYGALGERKRGEIGENKEKNTLGIELDEILAIKHSI